MSANWDHFPKHESYASDRLPVSMLAARPHVTTAHRGFEWLPGEEAGLFLASSPAEVRDRVVALSRAAPGDVIAMGMAAHAWVRNRLSNRQAARFVLATLERDLMVSLPKDPWHDLAREWPA